MDKRQRSRSRSRGERAPEVKRVLVTGAAGLLGKVVATQLLESGHDVIGFDLAPKPETFTAEYIQGDLTDSKALEVATSGCSCVVHCGGISGPGFVFDPPVPAGKVASTNILGTLNVLEACRHSGVKRAVFASSLTVYWPGRDVVHTTESLSEDAKTDSGETYSASKIAGEQLCRSYSAHGYLETVSLRISWVYGPGRMTGCPIKELLLGGNSTTPLHHCRDFVFVDDAARALVLAAVRHEPFYGTVLNISGAFLPHAAIEGAVKRACGKDVPRDASAGPPVDPLIPPLDISKAKTELGWEPQVPISEGIWRTAKHLNVARSTKPLLDHWLGLWSWDTDRCIRAFEYYQFWGTLTDDEARECATSKKEFRHSAIDEGRLTIGFRAADTTRNADFAYDIKIDGQPHNIDGMLRARANNSIKLNEKGTWSHWWDGDTLIMEQPCTVRGQKLIHRVIRVVDGDMLQCHELVMVQETRAEVLKTMHAFKRIPDA